MQKRITSLSQANTPPADGSWLDLEALADVEVTSEDAEHPIESALLPSHGGSGWKAAGPGVQTIRLLFHQPQPLRLIRMRFCEEKEDRGQEFVLRWVAPGDSAPREIVRQQYHFSPAGATEEVEEYRVELNGASVLELSIVPNTSGGAARASLAEFRLA